MAVWGVVCVRGMQCGAVPWAWLCGECSWGVGCRALPRLAHAEQDVAREGEDEPMPNPRMSRGRDERAADLSGAVSLGCLYPSVCRCRCRCLCMCMCMCLMRACVFSGAG